MDDGIVQAEAPVVQEENIQEKEPEPMVKEVH